MRHTPSIIRWSAPALLLLFSACEKAPEQVTLRDPLDRIQERGTLRVVTRNAPTTWFIDREGKDAGPEYDLARSFADALAVELELIPAENPEEILAVLQQGDADIAAAGLTATEARQRRFDSSPAYQTVRQQVVCRRGGKRAKRVAELHNVELAVPRGSSYVDTLRSLQIQNPRLSWQETDDEDTEALLERVWRRELDCTIADSNIVAINRRYYPELVVTFDISDDQQLVWYMARPSGGLGDAVAAWLEEIRGNGEVDAILERYYGFAELFNYVDVRKFLKRIERRLPKFRSMFEAAAEETGLHWTLLAAQSYQESHWDPRARSPTGVRGIMMLTLTTAREMGVTSRLDPAQSIEAGARYLARLRDRLPEEIYEPDRTWIALAAYNVGMGHVRDAFTLAKRLDKVPWVWKDLKTVLPLLARKKYYKTLRYGYARGWEPVRYVDNIRNYEEMLVQHVRNHEARTTAVAEREAAE